MDFNDLFTTSVKDVIKYTQKQYLSPYIFLDIQLFDNEGNRIKSKIDWDTLIVETVDDTKEYQKIIIAIYLDNSYMNEALVTMNNSANSRLNESKTQ